jgi:hypothetical protein
MKTTQLNLLGSPPVEIISDRERAIAQLNALKSTTTKTVTSVSGGKSSAYMAVHYPADYLVFAVVLTEDPACEIKDKGLLEAVRSKCPDFQGSRELDLTLENVLRLEQLLGQEIHWVWGKTYDRLIRERVMLPNKAMRFCTEELKIRPIFEWTFKHLAGEYSECLERFVPDPIQMNIGFRAEERRVYKMLGANPVKGGWDWSKSGCEGFKASLRCDIAGQYSGNHRWIENYEWRFRQAPMFIDGVRDRHVKSFWRNKGWEFPEISNCDFCMFHTPKEIQRQRELYPDRAQWGIRKEAEIGATFNKDASLQEIFDGKPTPLFDVDKCTGCTD